LVYGSFLEPTLFPNAVVKNASGTYVGYSLKRIKNPSEFIMLADDYSGNASYENQLFQLAYNDANAGLAHAKHSGQINAGFAGGNVSPLSPSKYGELVVSMTKDHGGASGFSSANIYYYDENLVYHHN
jgi:prepilin-type processing-associated H-X9-DG protein